MADIVKDVNKVLIRKLTFLMFISKSIPVLVSRLGSTSVEHCQWFDP